MKVNGKIMKYQDMVFTNGQMEGNTLAIGKVILWTSLDYTLGKMAECMKASIKRIRNMDMVFTHGLIRKNMQDGGIKASNMV